MMNKIVAFLTALTVAHCLPSATADCIGSFKELNALQIVNGPNNTVPITYVICPNTVFNLKREGTPWYLHSYATYLCGEDGSSANNCVVTKGDFQLEIAVFAYDRSFKDNIVVSGFTFQKAEIVSAGIASSGNFTIRDCIFKDHKNHGVLQLIFYLPPMLPSNRRLGSSMNEEANNFDYKSDYINFLKDPKLREQRQKDRSLLIGGGSEPRLTLLLDRVQFLNNKLNKTLAFPTLGSNGPIDIVTAFADVTVSKCLFKENKYEFRTTNIFSDAFAIRVASSSTLNISDTCFIDNEFDSQQTVWIRADSGLVSSMSNYVSNTKSSLCEYIFMEEAYKCIAPESDVCSYY